MRLVTRAQWGAVRGRGPTNVDAAAGGVAVHYEGAGKLGGHAHALCAAQVRGIEDFHVNVREWAGIAYSLLVCDHGFVFEGRGPGHRTAAQGTDDGNDRFYAVCALIGDEDVLTDELLEGMRDAIDYLRVKGAGDEIKGHRYFHPTDCPGDPLQEWVEDGAARPHSRGDEMAPIRTSLGLDKPQLLEWNSWTALRWGAEYGDPAGAHADGQFPGYVAPLSTWADFSAHLTVEALAASDECLLVRYVVRDWKDGKAVGPAWAETVVNDPATGRLLNPSALMSKGLSRGQHVHVQVNPVTKSTTPKPAPRVTAGRWTIAQDASS